MHLTPDQIAAAEISGCTFRPATAAEVQRLSMQRRVFFIDGQPVLGTRGDGFFETVGTLEKLIAEGRQVQNFMASAAPAAAASVAARGTAALLPRPGDGPEAASAKAEVPQADPSKIEPAPAKPTVTVAARPRPPAAPPAEAGPPDAATPGSGRTGALPARKPRARRQPVLAAPVAVEEASPAAPTPAEAEASPAVAPAPAAEASAAHERPRAAIRQRENSNPRWMTAGAARRGRATVHWTARTR